MVDEAAPDLTGRVAVVTGSTRGIGREIALGFARCGASIVVVGRTRRAAVNQPLPGSVEDTVDEIVALGGSAIGVHADLCDEAATASIVDSTVAAFGRCDVLVNNAAYTSNGPILDVPWHRWGRAFRVQVVAPHQLCHGFLPGMLDRGRGAVINVSSGASLAMTPGLALYSTSKAAMERWADYLDLEVAGRGVAITTLRVDRLVATEGWRHIARTQGADVASGGSPDTVPITATSAAAAVTWIARQSPSWSGHTVGFADIERLGGPSVETIATDSETVRLGAPP